MKYVYRFKMMPGRTWIKPTLERFQVRQDTPTRLICYKAPDAPTGPKGRQEFLKADQGRTWWDTEEAAKAAARERAEKTAAAIIKEAEAARAWLADPAVKIEEGEYVYHAD